MSYSSEQIEPGTIEALKKRIKGLIQPSAYPSVALAIALEELAGEIRQKAAQKPNS